MRARLAAIGLTAIAGILIGASLAWWMAGQDRLLGRVEADGWWTNPGVGATDADWLTRAVTARTGLMALNRSEAVYYFRERDERDRPFDAACTYRIEVDALPARWWSITVYDEARFLARNEDDAHSLGASQMAVFSMAITLSPQRPEGAVNWLSTRNAGRFSLLLRLYHPQAELLDMPGDLVAPRLRRMDCPGPV